MFGHMLGVLPECLIIAAAMHTRSIFLQPFGKRVQSFTHKIRWDRGMHSDPIATVNAYKVMYLLSMCVANIWVEATSVGV